MRRLKSDIVFTLSGPFLKNGIITTDDFGKILDIEISQYIGAESDVEYFEGAICPGFINAHCHLELSFAKAKIEKAKGINQFITCLEEQKRLFSDTQKLEFAEIAEQQMYESGIVGVGDICNTALTFELKAKKHLQYYNFIEVFGSLETKAETNFLQAEKVFNSMESPKSIVPHAPYSVSLPLFQKIADFEGNTSGVISIHHLESKEELDFFKYATGEIADRLKSWNIPLPTFIPSENSPFDLVKTFLKPEQTALLVHNTFLTKEELQCILNFYPSTFFVLCPLSNMYIGQNSPDYGIFRTISDKVCLGTDSLASNEQLSILEEMKQIQKEVPDLDMETLLIWACKNGAEALKFIQSGSIEKGKTPGLVHLKNFNPEQMKLHPEVKSTRII